VERVTWDAYTLLAVVCVVVFAIGVLFDIITKRGRSGR